LIVVAFALPSTVASADKSRPQPASKTRGAADEGCPFGEVDWTAVFLTEFAVGGCAENCYDTGCPAHCKKCQALAHKEVITESEEVEADEGTASDLSATESLWVEEDVFCVEHKANQREGTADQRSRGTVARGRGLWRGTGQVLRTAKPSESSRRLLAQDAAAEILKLRRSVGINPIAGTIFESAAPAGSGLEDASAGQSMFVEVSDDETIEAAVRQLEEDEAASSAMPSEFATWPSPEPAGPWAAQLLRPAERRLEEAAELLEQLGQYERADAARELAQEIRQDAREAERARQESAVIYSRQIAR